ncbi:MAG TPA: hypothetical protein VFX96_18740 [Pyrinomonadaceae bacterium]|nr:hypothetical protein [Pyrinomonadaceae bacterium]
MKTVLKASVFCWGIVVAFFIFFLIPFEVIGPSAAALLSMSLGGGLLVWLGLYVYRLHKKEGFDVGWFMVEHRGFWRLLGGAIGLALFLVGGFWFLAPREAELRLGEAAMPLAALLVVLFWFSLIFTFLGFALVCFAQAVAYARIKEFKSAAGSFALAAFWLALATLFCSLFLEVIHDNFLGLSVATQNLILGLFALAVTCGGLLAGVFQAVEKLLPEEELETYTQKRKAGA